MTTLVNTFEGGTVGYDISAGNSGGDSGNAFDAVEAGTGVTRVYDDSASVHGTLSAHFATGATSAKVYLQWDQDSIGNPPEIFERWYFMVDALPGSAKYIREWRDKDAAQTIARLALNSGGTLSLSDTTGTNIFTTTATITPYTWYRVEVHLVADPSTGLAVLKLYSDLDSNVPAETKTSAATQNFGSTIVNRSRNGWCGSGSNLPNLWLDDWALSTFDWVGPAVTSIVENDAASADDVASLLVAGTVSKSGSDTATAVDVGIVRRQVADDYKLRFGASALYGAEAMTEADSFVRFYDELGTQLDFYRANADTVPTTVAGSGLAIAAALGLDCQLAVRTDWVAGARDSAEWADDLTKLLVDLEANAPTMKVAFVLNPEPEFETTKLLPFDDPNAELALLTGIEEAARYREHVLALARAIWEHGNDNYSVQLAFSGYNSLRFISTGARVLELKTLEFAEFGGTIDWTNEERAKVTLLASVYPRLDENGDVLDDLDDVDQRLLDELTGGGTITSQLPFWEFAEQGYRRFGISDFAYNADLCPTAHAKIRDAWRGHDSTPTAIPGSLGDFLATTLLRVETFTARERSFHGSPEQGGPGSFGTLHASATRLDGYADLLAALRVTVAASEDVSTSDEFAEVEITGTHEVFVEDMSTSDDWAVYEDA